MRSEKTKCPICGTEITGVGLEDCPYCDWTYSGWEHESDENTYFDPNYMTLKEARDKFKQGLDIWGEPLKKKN